MTHKQDGNLPDCIYTPATIQVTDYGRVVVDRNICFEDIASLLTLPNEFLDVIVHRVERIERPPHMAVGIGTILPLSVSVEYVKGCDLTANLCSFLPFTRHVDRGASWPSSERL
jgi:hypothetical protein